MRKTALLVAPLFLLLACGNGRVGAGLVEVREVSPRHAEVGEFFRVTGAGFPEGRPAQVTLRGDLHRAGEATETGVELEAEGRLAAPNALDVVLTSALATRFCGGATDGRHTTFRGDLEISFAPRTSHGSAVSGRLDGVVLDVSPERPSPSTSLALTREGERFASFLGLRMAPSEQGLAVEAVEPKSRAARAGLGAGDIVLELEGMVVRETGDFVPPPNTRWSEILVQRDAERRPVPVESAGFRGSSPRVLAPAVLLIGLFVATFLAFRSPLGRLLGFLGRRAAESLRSPSLATFPAREPGAWERVLRGITRQLPESFAPYVALIVQAVLFTFLAFGKALVAAELDLVVLLVGGASGLGLAALATGGARGTWSFGRALGSAISVLVLELPLIAALFTVAVTRGGLRATDIVAAQGPWPWQWHAFSSPLLAASATLALLSRVPATRSASDLSRGEATSRAERLLDLAEWAHMLVISGILTLLFFGGFRHPIESAETWGTAIGAFVLLLKSWSIVGGIALVRSAFGRIDAVRIRGAALAWLVVPSLVCVGLAVAARRVLGGAALSTLESRIGPVLFVVVLVIGVWFVRRTVRGLREPSAELGIQPWL